MGGMAMGMGGQGRGRGGKGKGRGGMAGGDMYQDPSYGMYNMMQVPMMQEGMQYMPYGGMEMYGGMMPGAYSYPAAGWGWDDGSGQDFSGAMWADRWTKGGSRKKSISEE